MRSIRGSRIIVEELEVIREEDFQEQLLVGDSLREICAQLHFLVNHLVDIQDLNRAIIALISVIKTIRVILQSMGPEIKGIVRSLKRSADLRPELKIGRNYAPR